MGLSVLRIGDPQRRDRLLLLNALAILLLTLLGAAGESLGMDRSLSSTLPILSGVAERFGESLPECGRNFHAIRVEPGH